MPSPRPTPQKDPVAELKVVITELLSKQSNMLSEMMDSMKGSFSGQVRSIAVGQDVGHDESIKHSMAMIPMNSKFWFDQIAFQVVLGNNQALIANGELVKSLRDKDGHITANLASE